MTDSLRVVLVDDHELFRHGLGTMLTHLGDVDVVAEAGTGDAAVQAADQHRPDVVVMDLQMPGLSGIDATRRITSDHPAIGVLVVTMHEDDTSVVAALRAGARGYVLKGASPDEFLRALRAVAHGDAVLSPSVAARLRGYVAPDLTGVTPPFPELSDREREVLDLIAAGRSNAEISRQLYISGKTVRNHITNIFSKLHVSDRAQAIVLARDAGLGHQHG